MSHLAPAAQSLEQFLQQPTALSYASAPELDAILAEERQKFEQTIALNQNDLLEAQVEEIRLRFAGKKSPLQELLKSMKNLEPAQRKEAGARINELKTTIEAGVAAFVSTFQEHKEAEQLLREKVDFTLPTPDLNLGIRHPIAETMALLIDALRRLGFTLVDGPELEHDFYNFEALNQPADHPAREMQDTMFLSAEWLLRSHTSNVQAHAMIERGVPLKIICPGYVYRRDYDMTHSPAFRQVECLVVDKCIHMGHLRHTINSFLGEVFGRPVKTRFRSSFFPFTEPSAELDVECQQCFGAGCRSCKGTGWSELGGCGMVNRNVLKICGVDPDVYSGFAFGFGVDRIAMSRYGFADLRSMYEGDISLFKNLLK
jgi:phenylalanyl-tRNA synthetase alpha chain